MTLSQFLPLLSEGVNLGTVILDTTNTFACRNYDCHRCPLKADTYPYRWCSHDAAFRRSHDVYLYLRSNHPELYL